MHIFLFSIVLSLSSLIFSLYMFNLFSFEENVSNLPQMNFQVSFKFIFVTFWRHEWTYKRTNEQMNEQKQKKISLFCHHIFNISANGCCGDVLYSFWIYVRMCVVNWEILCASGVWIRIAEMMYEVNWCPSTYVLTTLDQHYLTLARL